MPAPLEDLRAQLALHRPVVPSQGYPLQLRADSGRWARAQRAEGLSWADIGEALGVCRTTARGWAMMELPGGPRAMMEVQADLLPVQVLDRTAAARVLLTPKGFRVEGLELDELASLLEMLG